jgi:hypothetical protein
MYISILTNGQGKKVDDEDGYSPANDKIQKHERKAEHRVRFVKNMQKWKVQHDDAHDEKNDPRFAQLQAV